MQYTITPTDWQYAITPTECSMQLPPLIDKSQMETSQSPAVECSTGDILESKIVKTDGVTM